MDKKSALIFGFNKYAFEIVQNVKDTYQEVFLYSNNKNDLEDETYDAEYFDLSDDWSSIENSIDTESSVVFCVLADSAENIFLTISLREYFPKLSIIAIASNKENATKLSLAGANKVIPVVETTADIITNILQLPISNKVLHSILFEENDLKIAQIKIDEHCNIKDEEILSIDWSRYKGIIVLSLMHEDMKSEFIYSSKAKNHILTSGDTLVVVGYKNDIQEFRKYIRNRE
ncbi:potassium transporter TrkA [Sulfurimonas aquatica]|uniref:Potassium transporter TrkA n=1 Tax=Sulfurimonas aquatica TaxID=2672570 RepID=A0A975B0Y1_9BACT|nr:NAD-binding protein [Sulfurimonas aquatica]QSZ42105.1 potassium transporter TrkA [Sulfurimonas aquatica]